MTQTKKKFFRSDRDVSTKSGLLAKKEIAVAVSGGIGAVEIVKIIREIRRYGARVTPFLSPSAELFITTLSVEWAANESVVKGIGAEVEHLQAFDLVCVVPATLNTIAKSAMGLADNAVNLLVATQLGRKGHLLFVPTMNEAMIQHPRYQDHVSTLTQWGAHFLSSPLEEGRLKVPAPELVVEAVIKCLKS